MASFKATELDHKDSSFKNDDSIKFGREIHYIWPRKFRSDSHRVNFPHLLLVTDN